MTNPAMGWGAVRALDARVCAEFGPVYARPTRAAVDAMQRDANRAAAEAVWDQALFNEVLLRPSAGPYVATGATVRVLEIEKFMNSKVLFTRVRHETPPPPAATRPPCCTSTTTPTSTPACWPRWRGMGGGGGVGCVPRRERVNEKKGESEGEKGKSSACKCVCD